MKTHTMPVMREMCATCPFRPGSKYSHLAADLGACALTEKSRICHSTGTNIIGKRTGKPERLCRGARNLQLQFFKAIGFIQASTDEAWNKKREELSV